MTDLWDQGYDDGIADAIHDLENTAINISPEQRIALMRLLATNGGRYTDCAACDGSGENRSPTKRDILSAMMISAGAQTRSPVHCKTCHGKGFVEVGQAVQATGETG